MAIQQGIIQFTGKLGDLVMYGVNSKIRVRGKSKKPHQLSEGTKKANKDFGYASTNASYIRKAFAPMVVTFGNDNLINRLNTCMVEILSTVPAEFKGNKNLKDGNISLLNRFSFSTKRLGSLLNQFPQINIDGTGMLTIRFLPVANMAWFKRYQKHPMAYLQLMVFNYDLEGEYYEKFTAAELIVDTRIPDFDAATQIQTQQTGEQLLLVCLGITYGDATSKSGDRKLRAAGIIKAIHLKDGVEVHYVEPPIAPKIQEEEIVDMVWGRATDYN